jgi:hypothetical protein
MRAFLFALFACVLSLPLAAHAADSVFTVRDVPVDASAAAAVEAQTIAINNGQSKAWDMLYRRLTRQEDWARKPQLDHRGLQHLIRTYSVSDERRSTTRYVAKVTYVFSQAAVARLLRGNGIPYVDNKARRILVVPMAPRYQPNAVWTQVWRDPRFANGIVPLVAPTSDPADEAALSTVTMENASLADLAPVMARSHASDAVLVQLASGASGQAQVFLRRLGPGDSLPSPVTVPMPAGSHGAALAAVADATAAAIANGWKDVAAVDYSQRSTITADTTFSSVADWARFLKKLTGNSRVVGVDTLGFAANAARLNIAFVGTVDQLRSALADAGLDMRQRGDGWLIAPNPVE